MHQAASAHFVSPHASVSGISQLVCHTQRTKPFLVLIEKFRKQRHGIFLPRYTPKQQQQ